MSVKLRIYHLLVTGSPEIRDTYLTLSSRASSRRERLGAYAALAVMNAARLAGVKHPGRIGMKTASARCFTGGNTARKPAQSPEELAERLAGYDVISFDVFDTLIFRRTKEPSGVFRLMGEALARPDFQTLRQECEQLARKKKRETTGNPEVTLSEIWQEAESRTGIPAAEGVRLEEETERRVCYANPYMKRVTDLLVSRGRRYIVTSDMYLSEERIRGLLEQCGYQGIDRLYISCEIGLSKSGGELFDYIRSQNTHSQNTRSANGRNRSYIHVGDNRICDVRNAARRGWDSVHYRREEKEEGNGDYDSVL